MELSGFQKSELQDIKFHWEDPGLNMDAVFRPGIDTPVFSSTSKNFETVSVAENTILIDKVQDKKNSPPLPTIKVSERPIQPPVLMRSRPFVIRIKNVPEHGYEKLFE